MAGPAPGFNQSRETGHGRHQFSRLDRFREVRLIPGAECARAILRPGVGRESDSGNGAARVGGKPPDSVHEIVAVDARQADIADDEIHMAVCKH
jgi:hypothetical protein